MGAFLLALGLGSFLVLALWNINLPGLYYDEALFVPPALQIAGDCGIDAAVSFRIGCIPIFEQPIYLGTLKSFLHAPIFMAFGTSVLTIRLPSILLSFLSIAGAFAFFSPRIGVIAAATVCAVLGSDPIFVFHTRLDWGTFVFAATFRMAALALLIYWTETGRPWPLAAFCAVCLLGLYDKLNFVWTVAGLSGGALLVYHREIGACDRRHRLTFRVILGGFAAALLAVAIFRILPAMALNISPTPFDLAAHAQRIVTIIETTLDGQAQYNWMFKKDLPADSRIGHSVFHAQIILGSVLALPQWRHGLSASLSAAHRVFVLIHAAILLIIVQLVLTKEVGGSHHVVTLFPFLQVHMVLMAVLILGVAKLAKRQWARPMALALVGSALVLVLYHHVSVGAAYLQALTPDGTYAPNHSPAIYALRDRMANTAAKRVVSVDWGIHQSLVSLAPLGTRERYLDRWPWFHQAESDPRRPDPVELLLRQNDDIVFIARDPTLATFPDTWSNFQISLKRFEDCVTARETVQDAKGYTAYHLIRISTPCAALDRQPPNP